MLRVNNINREILQQLTANEEAKLEQRFPKLSQWKSGELNPTVNQLDKLAKAIHIPFGYFFLEQLPKEEYPIPHYRTKTTVEFTPSSELWDTIDAVQRRQLWAKDLLLELGHEKLPFANKYSVESDVIEAADAIYNILDLPKNWAKQQASWSQALKTLIDKAEAAGVFVILNGVVGNNTHRDLKVNEFRGFVLYDDIAPFIFINNKDAVSGKIFTLIHEFVHILIGESASFDLEHLQPANNKIESFCDRVTAEFLVPEIALLKAVGIHGNDFQALAKSFKVSQIVIARRLLDLNIISRDFFFDFYNTHISKEHKVVQGKGGNFYNTAPYRISKKFFQLVHTSVQQGNILYRDAFKLTNLKPNTFDEYIKRNV